MGRGGGGETLRVELSDDKCDEIDVLEALDVGRAAVVGFEVGLRAARENLFHAPDKPRGQSHFDAPRMVSTRRQDLRNLAFGFCPRLLILLEHDGYELSRLHVPAGSWVGLGHARW